MTRLTLFVMNLLLAAIWVLLWGDASFYTILVGLVGGYFVLWVFMRAAGEGEAIHRAYGLQTFSILRFSLYFIVLLVRSNLQLAWEIITPGWSMSPRIIRYDVSHLTSAQIVAFSNALTLTPGTLTVDISDDQRYLYIHFMYAADPDRAVRDLDVLRRRMERQLFRRSTDPGDPRPASAAEASAAATREAT